MKEHFYYLVNITMGDNYGLPSGTLSSTVVNISKGLLAVTSTLAVLFVVVGAFMYVTSGGNDEHLDKAKKTITWAVGGLLVASLAWSIVYIISAFILSPDSGIS